MKKSKFRMLIREEMKKLFHESISHDMEVDLIDDLTVELQNAGVYEPMREVAKRMVERYNLSLDDLPALSSMIGDICQTFSYHLVEDEDVQNVVKGKADFDLDRDFYEN